MFCISLDKQNNMWSPRMEHGGNLISLFSFIPLFPSSSPSSSGNWYSLFGLPCSFRLFSLVVPLLFERTEWMIFSVNLCERFLPWIYGIQKVGLCGFLPSEVKLCILHFHSIHSRFSLVCELLASDSEETWDGRHTRKLHRLLEC